MGKTCYLPTTIEQLQLGAVILKNVKALIALRDWSGATKYKNWTKGKSYKNGVITLGFLSKYNVLFDLPNNILTLYDKTIVPSSVMQWNNLSFILQEGVGVTTPESFDGKVQNIIWDSALTPSIINPAKIDNTKIYSCPSQYSVFARQAKCYTSTGSLATAFWAHDLGLPPQAPIDGVIGSNYFFAHQVFVDFGKRRLYLK